MAEERTLSAEQRDQIRQAVAAGDHARALEMVRKFAGLDVESAKAYLEELEELFAMSADADSGATKGGSLTEEEWKTIDQFIFTGHKLTAVKMARSSGGYDLKEAKDLVDAREAELKKKSPEKFKPVKSGCMGKAAMVLLALGGAGVAIGLMVYGLGGAV